MDLANLVVDVGALVARLCDSYVKIVRPSYQENRLENIVVNSEAHKARLLHYSPTTLQKPGYTPNWCGWHNDHGAITGLVSNMFINKNGQIVSNPDDKSGLYIRKRDGDVVQVDIAPDQIAFQIGESAQILSGGALNATPHSVRGPSIPTSTGRETFAVFMQPSPSDRLQMPVDCVRTDVLYCSDGKHKPPRLPSLRSRWYDSMTFGEFHDSTLNSYNQ